MEESQSGDEKVIYISLVGGEWSFCKICLLKLYQMQEAEEKSEELTILTNDMGFNKGDAMFLTRMAKFVLTGGEPSPQDKEKISQKLQKYSTQLARYSEITILLR